ncbi:XrtA/PEP-CTERM system histidine kinase PrsK [Glaciecola petra]|uniref:histidine kinase n=1 Tax=Glaciecola petra TaxID=3075602 RepID=A0ABU2ZN65_9ALTE|nr:XrtA/PEP-CTERM system histidine kinase PrsK [Aestuariibacter sp. P117]MDT0593483.1 PEP-CTERM system histidine kinase PrsK [Aestuariibacter sp. P117]
MIFDIGYSLTAFGYLLLVFLLLVGKKAGLVKRLLLCATVVTFLWSVMHIQAIGIVTQLSDYVTLDSVRLLIWSLFLAACLQNQSSSFWRLLGSGKTLTIITLPMLGVVLSLTHIISPSIKYLVFTLITIEFLVLLEQLFRQSAKQKWEYKPLIIYLGALTTFDFFTYANAAMVNNLNWAFFAARGYIYLALLPFLVLAIRRIQQWGIEIFVSREVVMHSTLLMLSGVYLLVMALLGYIVNYFGGEWGAPIQIALFLIAIALLLSLFLSHEFRTKLKVFITKNFYANQFDYRVEWVALTQRLSIETKSLPDIYQAALIAWMQGIKYRQGLLVKLSNDQTQIVAQKSPYEENISHKSLQLVPDIVAFMAKKPWIIDLLEMQKMPEMYEELPNRNEFMKSFGYQLTLPIFKNQELWGLVMLNSPELETRTINWELRDYLTAVTDQTANFIFQAESSQALAENAQFAAFNRMSAFVVHDLKNVLAQVNLLLANAKQHKSNPEFIDDTFETLEHTKARMDKMLKQLMDKSVDGDRRTSTTKIIDLIEELIETKCKSILPHPTVSGDVSLTINIEPEKFANVLYHIVSNAQQATNNDGKVNIVVEEADNLIHVVVCDNGSGMTQSFINEKLFVPFETTKGNAGMGIGAYDAKTYMESIGGSLSVTSIVGEGSQFTLNIPKLKEID